MKKLAYLSFCLPLMACGNSSLESGPPLADTPWPIVGHDVGHTGQSQYAGPAQPILIWPFTTEEKDYNVSAPSIGIDGSIVFGTYGWNVYSVAANGALNWKKKIYGYAPSPPTIAQDGTVYFTSFEQWDVGTEGVLTAISSSGDILWDHSDFAGGLFGSPVIGGDGTIYIGDDEGYVHALHHTGKKIWSFDAEGSVRSSPALDGDGNIYFTAGKMGQGHLYCISREGRLNWVFSEISEDITANPAIGPDGTILFPAGDGNLYAITSAGGLRWKKQINVKDNTNLAVSDSGNVYVITWDEMLYSFTAEGVERWSYQHPTVQDLWAVLIDSEETIFLAGEADDIVLFSLSTDGEENWQFHMDGTLLMNPNLAMDASGTIYLGTEGDRLYAVGDLDSQ